MPDERLDPGRTAEHGFQIREHGKRVKIRVHEREIFDIRRIARLGPDTNLQIGKLFAERVALRPGVADMFVGIDDEQRHDRLLRHETIMVAQTRQARNLAHSGIGTI